MRRERYEREVHKRRKGNGAGGENELKRDQRAGMGVVLRRKIS